MGRARRKSLWYYAFVICAHIATGEEDLWPYCGKVNKEALTRVQLPEFELSKV